MSLAVSASGIYFPDVPRDNVLQLQWREARAALTSRGPSTLVVFKLKCSFPQLFYVRPRYGVLLLLDESGMVLEPSSSTPNSLHAAAETSVVVGRREYYQSIAKNDTATTLAPASSTRRSGERFAVEYALLSGDGNTFRQIAQALDNYRRLTDTVKNTWAMIDSGTIAAARIGVRDVVSLRVYMGNVVLQESSPRPDGKCTVVPPGVTLIPLSLQDSANERLTNTPCSTATANVRTNPSSTPARLGAVDALQEEIDGLREEVRSTPGGSNRNYYGVSPPRAHSDSDPFLQSNLQGEAANGIIKGTAVASSNGPSVSIQTPAKDNRRPGPPDSDDRTGDLLMQLTTQGSGARGTKGLKIYLVLLLMFTVYCIMLWIRRGRATAATTSGERSNATSPIGLSQATLEPPSGKDLG